MSEGISLAENVDRVRHDLSSCAQAAGREPDDVRLIAVSKTRSLQEVEAATSLGIDSFGENTVQDAMTKIPYLGHDIEWHFIGHLQSKKSGRIPGHFQWVHSIDSVKLISKLSAAMSRSNIKESLNCLLQVNVSAEAAKSGFMPPDIRPAIEQILEMDLPCIRLRGLMTIGVRQAESETRRAFAGLRQLQVSCRDEFSLEGFDQLSMGMSGDYCLAIEEGSTMVRVGTAIFGDRPPN